MKLHGDCGPLSQLSSCSCCWNVCAGVAGGSPQMWTCENWRRAIVFEALELPGGKSQVINSDRTIVGVEARTWGVTARVQCSV
jgi:hypothetical protein